MQLLHTALEILRNLPETASSAGGGTGGSFNPSDWLPGLFGGTAGGIGNVVRQGIINKAQEQQEQHQNQDQEKQTDKRIHDLL